MTPFVSRISVPGTKQRTWTSVACPQSSDEHVINVICGRNNSGKSHVLRSMHHVLKHSGDERRQNESGGVLVELTPLDAGAVKTSFLGKAWKHKEKVGSVSMLRTTELPRDRSDYRRSALLFLHRQLKAHLPSVAGISSDDWLGDGGRRESFVKELDLEDTLYRCDESDPFVRQLEGMLNASLYMRRASRHNIEFAFVHSRTVVPFARWSDGQQAVFHLLLTLEFERPDVLLIDEIENHMHPSLMTASLGVIKSKVPQTFIATHHPHLIFSLLVDKVLFLDANESPREAVPPTRLSYTKIDHQSSPDRQVLTLDTSFDRIAGAYRLFDHQDVVLLKQASLVESAAEIVFGQIVAGLCADEVRPSRGGIFPDRQTLDLIDRVQSLSGLANPPKRILDLGAGVGRMVSEAAKLAWHAEGAIKWMCWEPDPVLRETLKANVAAFPEVHVLDTLRDVPDQSCDVVVIANVLHERPPQDFARIMTQAGRCLRAADSVLLLMELYPLLSPEKYAVPYSSTDMKRILNSCGFVCTDTTFPVKDVTGYCIVARIEDRSRTTEEAIEVAIRRAWAAIEREVSQSYKARRSGVRTYADYRGFVQDLTTLASIGAWRHGLWM